MKNYNHFKRGCSFSTYFEIIHIKKRINHRSFIGTGDFMRFFIMSDSRRSLFPTSLAGVPAELLISYHFLTGSDVSRIT